MCKLSYALGIGIGSQLAGMGAKELNIDDFAQGAQQSAQGGTQQNGKEDIQDADFEEVK